MAHVVLDGRDVGENETPSINECNDEGVSDLEVDMYTVKF